MIRWRFTDPNGVKAAYTVPINPNAMTSPFANKNVTGAISPFGVGRVLQAPTTPVEWSFSGVIHEQAHYAALQSWLELGHGVRIRDHLNRTWTVQLLSFDATPTRSRRQWKHNYEMRALVYGGPQ